MYSFIRKEYHVSIKVLIDWYVSKSTNKIGRSNYNCFTNKKTQQIKIIKVTKILQSQKQCLENPYTTGLLISSTIE